MGISVSESPDLLRLGLLESHFRLALGEITRCILIAGGRLAYGGHLRPDGYTSFLLGELERYSRRDRPLRVCLAYSEHRRMTLDDIERQKRRLGLNGEIVCLNSAGEPIAANFERDNEPFEVDAEQRKQSLTSLRRHMIEQTHGRVLIGGKRRDFFGAMPGLLEESIMACERGQPLYFAGGFGGITWDIARALDIDKGDWFQPLPSEPATDPRVLDGLQRLNAAARKTNHQSLDNGLTAEENRRLAATHRPSEIAALLSIGLGRKFARPAVSP